MNIKKYRRLPEIILAIEFRPENTSNDLPKNVGFDEENGKFFVWNELHQSRVYLKYGDYIRVDMDNDWYPIDRNIFMRTYEFYSD